MSNDHLQELHLLKFAQSHGQTPCKLKAPRLCSWMRPLNSYPITHLSFHDKWHQHTAPHLINIGHWGGCAMNWNIQLHNDMVLLSSWKMLAKWLLPKPRARLSEHQFTELQRKSVQFFRLVLLSAVCLILLSPLNYIYGCGCWTITAEYYQSLAELLRRWRSIQSCQLRCIQSCQLTPF